jgi:hypothetical protein
MTGQFSSTLRFKTLDLLTEMPRSVRRRPMLHRSRELCNAHLAADMKDIFATVVKLQKVGMPKVARPIINSM